MNIERAHRTGMTATSAKDTQLLPRPRPIIVKFNTYKDRALVWERKTKLLGASIHMDEDFPPEIEARRKKIYPIMRAANAFITDDGKSPFKARLNVDKLIINSQPYTLETLDRLPTQLQPTQISTQEKGDYVCFWSKDSPFSNHHIAPFTIGSKTYNCVEQYLTAAKAEMFSDHDTAKRVMSTTHPAEQKSLGRTVKGFNNTIWKNAQRTVAKEAIRAKFEQNNTLREKLLSTKKKHLVEASPNWEKTWGVGLRIHDKNITDKSKWTGKNLLGELLIEVRSELNGA